MNFTRKGQASIEYVVVVALFLAIVIPLAYYTYYNVAAGNVQLQTQTAAEELARTADSLYLQGVGARAQARVYIPDGVEYGVVRSKEIFFLVRGRNGNLTEVWRPIKGTGTGDLPITPGYFALDVFYDANGNIVFNYTGVTSGGTPVPTPEPSADPGILLFDFESSTNLTKTQSSGAIACVRTNSTRYRGTYSADLAYNVNAGGNVSCNAAFETARDLTNSGGLSFRLKYSTEALTVKAWVYSCDPASPTVFEASFSTPAGAGSWNKITIPWSNFSKAAWSPGCLSLNLSSVVSIAFALGGASAMNGSMWVDEEYAYPMEAEPTPVPEGFKRFLYTYPPTEVNASFNTTAVANESSPYGVTKTITNTYAVPGTYLFYSWYLHPALLAETDFGANFTGRINAANFETSAPAMSFIIKMHDYDPATGDKTLLGSSDLFSAPVNGSYDSLPYSVFTNESTLSAGHRLLSEVWITTYGYDQMPSVRYNSAWNDSFYLINVTGTGFAISFVPPTPANASATNFNYVYFNASLSRTANTCILVWNNTNYSMAWDAVNRVCYYNRTAIADATYPYYVWANTSTGDSNVSETRTVTIEVNMTPQISFVAPTPPNETMVNMNYVYVNASLSLAPSACKLVWNNTNYSMAWDAVNRACYYNHTLVADGDYQYYVWANNSFGKFNASETRRVQVSAGAIYSYVTSFSAAWGSVHNLAGAQNASDGDSAALVYENNSGAINQSIVNTDFATNATGWTYSVYGTGLTAAFDAAYGNPAGSGYGRASGKNRHGYAAGATQFYYAKGTPASANLSFDRRVRTYNRGLTSNFTFLLQKPSGINVTIFPTSSFSAVDAAWNSTVNYSVPASALNESGAYLLWIIAELSTENPARPDLRIHFDNVRLDVKPYNYSYNVTFLNAGVPAGSTHRLQVRYRVTSENATLRVFNGTTWNQAASLTSASYAIVDFLLNNAEYNGGAVYARYLDANATGDTVQNLLEVEYQRVMTTP
ncbi:hypothetical protein AUJ65_05500 [Candidatus Micrarchaeota archaeon CG1_02_51_15]|nr:MAG: hypothetical protein AUJ65_05500 [Candidatus Micrarchaeota archaeon CG1_02_51_15]